MKEEQKSRSGKMFFLVAVGLIFAGILATVLLANGQRNLHLLLAYLGYPDLLATDEPAPKQVKIIRSKSVRLPPARMVLPVYAFADFKAPQQQFIRVIQSDPRTLCEQLRAGGFGDLNWTVSAATRTIGNARPPSICRQADETAQSSVFIFIKGDGENRVTSFRVKLNIEKPRIPLRSPISPARPRHLPAPGPLGKPRRNHPQDPCARSLRHPQFRQPDPVQAGVRRNAALQFPREPDQQARPKTRRRSVLRSGRMVSADRQRRAADDRRHDGGRKCRRADAGRCRQAPVTKGRAVTKVSNGPPVGTATGARLRKICTARSNPLKRHPQLTQK